MSMNAFVSLNGVSQQILLKMHTFLQSTAIQKFLRRNFKIFDIFNMPLSLLPSGWTVQLRVIWTFSIIDKLKSAHSCITTFSRSVFFVTHVWAHGLTVQWIHSYYVELILLGWARRVNCERAETRLKWNGPCSNMSVSPTTQRECCSTAMAPQWFIWLCAEKLSLKQTFLRAPAKISINKI